MATRMASVPSVPPVLANAYGLTPPQRAFTAPSRSVMAARLVFSSSMKPNTWALRPQTTIEVRSRWRLSSATLSAPRQSCVPLGPHGPELVLEVVSMVVK